MRQIFEVTDADAADALMQERYAAMTTSTVEERRYLRLELEQFDRARLDRMVYTVSARSESEALGVVCIGLVGAGTLTYDQRGVELPCVRGDVVNVGDPDLPLGVTWTDVDIEFVMLEPGLLNDVASTRDASDGPVRLTANRPISVSAAGRYTRLVRSLRDSSETEPVWPMHSSLVATQTARLLAAATLATFPSNARLEPTYIDRNDARPMLLRRAIAFIEAQPQEDLSVADIASAAGVTIRAVQLAFQRHLAMTPMAYLRRVRLAHAHDELRRADPTTTTVASVALRWGFGNASRFAARHREVYGESPSRTLES